MIMNKLLNIAAEVFLIHGLSRLIQTPRPPKPISGVIDRQINRLDVPCMGTRYATRILQQL